MTNKEISEILYNIAEILEIKEENRFRIIAYRNAARSIEHLAQDIEDIYKIGGMKALDKIEGIGASIAEKIIELLETGKCKYYKNLKKQIPQIEIILTQIPGIGAKIAKKLYKELKIKTIEELEEKAKAGLIRKLPGFKETTEKNIIEGIKAYKKRKKEARVLLTFAEPVANELAFWIKKNKVVKQADPVGSLRRMKETIGDIDIIIASGQPKKVMEYLNQYPNIKKVIALGETKFSFIHKKDLRIDIEILPPQKYGSLLQHFTGSKEHNVALRTFAKEQGFSLSEHGIYNAKDKKRIFFAKEKDFYNYLGMEFIPPELRENTGEIEAALSKKLPKLVKYTEIKGDLHVHTKYSDGHETIKEMAKSAQNKNYEYLCISDHTKGLGVAHGLGEKDLLKQKMEIRKIGKNLSKMHLLSGVEVNIKANGELDIPDRTLNKLDVVIASVHSSFKQSENVITKRIISAIKNPCVDIIGHPSGRIIFERDECEIEWPEIFKAAARYNTALEINSFPNRLDLKDSLIKEALKYGVKFAINTDSHKFEHLDLIKYGIATARRGWATKNDIINTLSFENLLKWLKQKRL